MNKILDNFAPPRAEDPSADTKCSHPKLRKQAERASSNENWSILISLLQNYRKV